MRKKNFLLFLVLFLRCNIAEAHLLPHPKTDELVITPQGIFLGIHYTLSPGDEPRALRRLFDQDHSGEIDEEESERLLDYLEISLLSSVTVRLDGERLSFSRALRRGESVRGPSAQGAELGIELVVQSKEPIQEGLHVVEIVDRGQNLSTPVPASILWQDGFLPLISSAGQIDFVAKSLGPIHLDGTARLKVVFLAP